MNYGKMLNQYQKARIGTAGKIDLVVMIYEKAIQCIHQAKAHYEENEFEKKAKKIQLSLDLINELQNSLDFEKGGQIAKNLDALYSYIIRRLIEGDIKKDTAALDEAVTIMGDLKEAWEGINKGEQSPLATGKDPLSNGMNSAHMAA